MLSQVSTRVQTSPETCEVDDGGAATLAGLNSGTFRIIVIQGLTPCRRPQERGVGAAAIDGSIRAA